MTIDWSPLRHELANWRANNMSPAIWWRDDDAVTTTPALDRLHGLAQRLNMTVALAVIPRDATALLAERLAETPHFLTLVHGWAHENHAPKGSKKAEFGYPRSDAESELAAGLERLSKLFGPNLQRFFVPPWNRLDAEFIPVLARLGYQHVSTFGLETEDSCLPFMNTHLDPIDWRGTRSLVEPQLLIAKAVETLQIMRTNSLTHPRPFGLLTHHLVHDDNIWAFSEAFLAEMLDGGATEFAFHAQTGGGHEPT